MAGAIKGITIEFRGDTTQLQKAVRTVDGELTKTQKSLRQVNNALKFNPKNVELLKQKQSLLTEEIKGTKTKLDLLKKAQKEMDAKGVSKNSQEYMNLRRQIIETESKLKTFKGQLKEIGNVNLTALSEKFKDLGGKMEEVGKTLTTKVTAPLLALGGAAIASFKSVDEGYDAMIAKTGATGDALQEMKQIFNDIAKTVPADMSSIGNAVGEVSTRFGITGDSLEELSTQFLKFAKLNGQDVVSAVDQTQKALSAYGLSAESAADYLDVMNKVAQDTGVDVASLQSGIITNAAAFQELGLNIDQATSFMGQLEKSGANSETVLNGMRKALKNAAQDGVPLEEALANLENQIKNGTEGMDGLTAAYDLFGKSGDQIYAALQNGTISFTNLAQSATNAGGSVSDTFDATLDPVDKLKLSLQSLKITGAELGNTLLTVLTPAIDKVSQAVEWISEKWNALDPETQEAIATIGLVVAAVGPLVIILGKIFTAVGTIISVVSTIISVISTVVGAIGSVIAALNPITLIIAAIVAAVVAIGVVLWKHWDTIKQKAKELFEKIKEIFTNIKNKIVETWQNIKSTVVGVVEGIKTRVSDIFEGIKSTVTTTINTLKSTVTRVFKAIKHAITHPIETAKSIVKGVVDKMKGFFDFKWELPHIKLPHFKVSGSANPLKWLDEGPPSLSIEWYAKGGIFNRPTIAGIGEAGPEAVVPLNKFWDKLDRITGGNSFTFNVNVSGAESPEAWAQRFVKQIELETRK